MKKLLNIGVLLVSLGMFAAPQQPVKYQYWFDNDMSSLKSSEVSDISQPISISIGDLGLSEGAHIFHYQMASDDNGIEKWGSPISKMLYIPMAQKTVNGVPTGYRLFINNDVVSTEAIPSDNPFVLTPELPKDLVLNSVTSRNFKYFTSDKGIIMTAQGKYSCALQLYSDENTWGSPLYDEIDHEVTTERVYADSIPAPFDHKFSKVVDNNHFYAFKFRIEDHSTIHLNASQDCTVKFFQMSGSDLYDMTTAELKKDDTKSVGLYGGRYDVLAVVYDTPVNDGNVEETIDLRIMFEENKLPQPEIIFNRDTWEVTIKCADERAKIYYTLDGSAPSEASTLYEGPFTLDKFTRIRAYAVRGENSWDVLADSSEADVSLYENEMVIPRPALQFVGDPELNQYILTNRIEGVTTYYTFGNQDPEDELVRVEFDGTPFTIPDNTIIRAYCVKEGLTQSEEFSEWVYRRNYVTTAPERRQSYNYEEQRYMQKLNVYDSATAYYRVVPGNQIFAYGDEIVESEWKQYDDEELTDSEGNIVAGNMTVQAYSVREGKAPSKVQNFYSKDWIKSDKPEFVYDNYKIKLSSDTPGAVIYYWFNGENKDSDKKIYDAATLTEGVDVRDKSYLYAYIEAEGYQDSDRLDIRISNYNQTAPKITYDESLGQIVITSDDLEAKIVPVFYKLVKSGDETNEEVFELEYTETLDEENSVNKVTCTVPYNTYVKAYVKKEGLNDAESTYAPNDVPVVTVDRYNVSMNNYWSREIRYTIDGTQPTRESKQYSGTFEWGEEGPHACTVRAAIFGNSRVPSECDPVRVTSTAAEPVLEFNFSTQTDEEGNIQEIKKVKFSTATPDAEIYYSFSQSGDENNWDKYSEKADAEGIDVGDNSTIYAYTGNTADYHRTEKKSFSLRDARLSAPSMSVSNDTVRIWHDDKNVTLVPVFSTEDQEYIYDKDNNEITCIVKYNSSVKAHSSRKGYLDSSESELQSTSRPTIQIDGYRVRIDKDWNATVYYTLDGTMPTKDSYYYDNEEFETDSCRVRAVAFKEGYIPAEADSKLVRHQAAVPTIEFNYNKVKFYCATKDAPISYRLNNQSDWHSYNPTETPDGIEFGDASYVYVVAEETEFYRRSEEARYYMSDANLSQPNLEYKDGIVRIWHDDKTVKIVPTFTPAQEYTYDEEKNEITCAVPYNTVVTAHVEKDGYINSAETDGSQILSDKPVITTGDSDYSFYINDSWNGYIYYTLDGTMPTAESKYYDGNWVYTDNKACTVRAVRFNDGRIPAESIAKVMDRVPDPQVEFNFSKVKETVTDEDGVETEVEKEIKKITFSCDVPEAKISYKLNNKMEYEVFDPVADADGIDVSETSNVSFYAEAEGYRRSNELTTWMSEVTLNQPSINYLPETNTVEITHSKKGVTIVPTFYIDYEENVFEPEDLNYDEVANKITCTVPYNTYVRAYAKKDGSYDSYTSSLDPVGKPTIYVDGYNVSISYSYSWDTDVYYTADGSMPTKESTRYESSFDTIPCTIRAVAFRNGYIPSEADSVKVMHITAKPEIVFNFDRKTDTKKVKFTSATPDAKFYWSFSEWDLNNGNGNLYDPESDPDGIDVSDNIYNTLYVYAQADGYRKSENASRYMNNGYLSEPNIYVSSGTVEITHDDPTVDIIATAYINTEDNTYEPEDLVYTRDEETNKITFTPKYNSVVVARAEKLGYYTSSDATRTPLNKPRINVDGYRVRIEHDYWNDAEIYYTCDGSMPTKESTLYESAFDTIPCTVRAVLYYGNDIPSEADAAKVMDQCSRPEVIFNFDKASERKKVKLSSPDANAKIYYSFDDWDLNYGNKTLYDAEKNPDGIDVDGRSYIYAHAEVEGYRRSDNISRNLSDGYLSQPNINVSSGIVEITHDDPTVDIIATAYINTEDNTYEPEDLVYTRDEETNKITFTPKYNSVVVARAEKLGYYTSSDATRNPLNKPRINVDGYRVRIEHDYWNDAEIYYTCDGSMPTKESTLYESAFDTIACTVRAVLYYGNDIPSEADAAKVMDQCSRPEVIFNFDKASGRKKVKLSSPDANAKIYYSFDEWDLNYGSKTLYDAEKNPDGINVDGYSYIYAHAEVDGYRRSDNTSRYLSEAYLSAPSIRMVSDTSMEISLDNSDANIVATFYIPSEDKYYTPEDLVYVNDGETNKITCTVRYNTEVKARSEKSGYYTSDEAQKSPYVTPYFNIDGYYVYIENAGYGDTYYTTDGSMPTRQSKYYNGGFQTTAGTVRAVTFVDGEIPAEATPGKVLDKAAQPEIAFNFSKVEKDGKTTEVKKVKFSSTVPGAKIYYAIDKNINSNTETLYNPASYPDGIDVGDASYVRAYVKADGYRDSDEAVKYTSEAYLSAPSIQVVDGVVEITHSDPTVTIIPVFTPDQNYEYVHDANTNKVTCKVAYNTTVRATVRKDGCFDSDAATASPIQKPVIVVNGYDVTISNYDWDSEVYYTNDGTMPTKDSPRYEDAFVSAAGTIRAVAFNTNGNGIPAEAEPVKVMDQAETPTMVVENGYGKLVASTPNAQIYYSEDVQISNSTRKLYSEQELPNGIDLSNVRTVYAYTDADGYRRSENLIFVKNDYVLNAPTLSYSNGYVTADDVDSDATVVFTDGNGQELTPEANNSRRVKVDYNSTVNAYTYKKGYINSSSVQIKSTDVPEISAELFTITIKGKSYQTLRYTTDGSMPTASSKLYSGPFSVTESCKVRAVAFADDLIPAEGTALDVAYRKSLKPEVNSYDGRYLTLKAEEGSTIKYVIGQNANISDAKEASGKIDTEGLNMIKAIAQRSDAEDSEVFSFTPEYYANETDVYTSKAGVLSKAFDWNGDKSIYTSLTVHGPILGTATEDNGDYAFLRGLTSLRHLDLTNVTDAAVPDGAFASMKLLSVTFPANMKTAGELLFGVDNNTLCAVELQSTDFAPANLLDGVKNPNLLLYVRNKNLVTDLSAQSPDVTNNVIVLGSVNSNHRAENITLAHGGAFFAPKEFTAQKITYTRAFTKETQIGGFGSGWETMVVPFDVQTISCGTKVCKPFGDAETDRGECPFWLFSGAETDWMAETSLMANTPYLIAFPNNPLYAEEYVVNGNVEFSASNVSVPVTPEEDEMTFGFGPSRYIVGNYQFVSKDEDVLALNEEVYNYMNNDFQPGGIFVAGQKDVVPFECFVWSESAPKAMPVFDQSAIDEIFGDTGVKIWSESYDIYIHSGVAMKVRIYDTVGQLVRSVNVKAGETVRVQDITPGIYFVGNYKLLVKK